MLIFEDGLLIRHLHGYNKLKIFKKKALFMEVHRALIIYCRKLQVSPDEQKEAAKKIADYTHESTSRVLKSSRRQDIDDITQQALLALWRARPQATTEPEAKAYISKTVRNLCIRSAHLQNREPVVFDDPLFSNSEEISELLSATSTSSAYDRPDKQAEVASNAQFAVRCDTWLQSTAAPAIADKLITRVDGRRNFLLIVEQMHNIRNKKTTTEAIIQSEIRQRNSPITPEQASNAVHRRFTNARIRLYEVMDAIDACFSDSSNFAITEAVLTFAQELIERDPWLTSDRMLLRQYIEWFCSTA